MKESYSEDRRVYREVQVGTYVNTKGELVVGRMIQISEDKVIFKKNVVDKLVDPFESWSACRFE